MQPHPGADRLQSCAVEPTSILLGEAISEANGACSDAKLFICSPHSCEVVKPVFFSRSFEDVNLKKGLPHARHCPVDGLPSWSTGWARRAKTQWPSKMAALADRKRPGDCRMNSKHASVTRSVWAALCGRCGGANTSALAVLRGPIRRRPYNRGEIVAKNAKEMGVFYDFY